VFFLGNIIITGWWKNMADRTKNGKIIAFAQHQVTVTDFIFTAGGAAILFVAGTVNVYIHGIQYSSKWLSMGSLMFTISGVIWAVILIPIQMKQAKMAKVFSETNVIPPEYWKLCMTWNIWGVIATLLPIANIYWMTFKPV
jgi:uncharacterized membrane protein